MSTLESFRLTGRVALVTGGARHLGYDMADALAEAGADLVITSRSLASAEDAAGRLRRERGAEVLPLALDVTDAAQVSDVVGKACDWKGRLDILVNNAGGGAGSGPCHLFERSPEDMELLIATNLTGSLFCCQAVARRMAEQGHGKIINIASISGLVGRDRRMYEKNDMAGQPVDYAAAKAGVIGMTLDLAGLLSPMGIHVNAISPGGFARGQPGTFEQDYADETPLRRMGRDESVDLKGAVLFLASEASDYVTGQNLVVDGGFTIWK